MNTTKKINIMFTKITDIWKFRKNLMDKIDEVYRLLYLVYHVLLKISPDKVTKEVKIIYEKLKGTETDNIDIKDDGEIYIPDFKFDGIDDIKVRKDSTRTVGRDDSVLDGLSKIKNKKNIKGV